MQYWKLGSDQISVESRKSCLWWVQHVNDLCVFIGHGAGPASLQDSGVGTTLWLRQATADGNEQQKAGLTWQQLFTVHPHCRILLLLFLLLLALPWVCVVSSPFTKMWVTCSPSAVFSYLFKFTFYRFSKWACYIASILSYLFRF